MLAAILFEIYKSSSFVPIILSKIMFCRTVSKQNVRYNAMRDSCLDKTTLCLTFRQYMIVLLKLQWNIQLRFNNSFLNHYLQAIYWIKYFFMIGINIIKTNKPDIKSHQKGCYFKRKKYVIRKVLISNIIFYFYFILICVLNVNLQHFVAVSLPLVFLFICAYWRHTQFSYKVMLVSSGAKSIRIFRIYPWF